jgi:hypothetical protein
MFHNQILEHFVCTRQERGMSVITISLTSSNAAVVELISRLNAALRFEDQSDMVHKFKTAVVR